MAVEPDVRPHRIELKIDGSSRYEEGFASAAISPGMLIERTPGTLGNEVTPHNFAGGGGEVMIALEDALQGKTINDAYVAASAGPPAVPADMISYRLAKAGEEYFVLLKDGEVAADGDPLTSGGDGTFTVAAAGEEVLAVAVEALSPSGANAHIKARITPQRSLDTYE